MEISTTELVTLALAIFGAALGLINTYRSIHQDKVRLKVFPKRGYRASFSGGEGYLYTTNAKAEHVTDQRGIFAVTIVNLSGFPVTIDEVGVTFARTRHRAVLTDPKVGEIDRLPYRLESRGQITIKLDEDGTRELFLRALPKKIYVETSCGVTKTATNSAFKALAKAYDMPAK